MQVRQAYDYNKRILFRLGFENAIVWATDRRGFGRVEPTVVAIYCAL